MKKIRLNSALTRLEKTSEVKVPSSNPKKDRNSFYKLLLLLGLAKDVSVTRNEDSVTFSKKKW